MVWNINERKCFAMPLLPGPRIEQDLAEYNQKSRQIMGKQNFKIRQKKHTILFFIYLFFLQQCMLIAHRAPRNTCNCYKQIRRKILSNNLVYTDHVK